MARWPSGLRRWFKAPVSSEALDHSTNASESTILGTSPSPGTRKHANRNRHVRFRAALRSRGAKRRRWAHPLIAVFSVAEPASLSAHLHVVRLLSARLRGGDVTFDQPWKIADPHIVYDRKELRRTQRYIVSNFTYSKGLGNLMFQYASLRSIATQHKAKLLIPSNSLLRRAFDLDAVVVTPQINDQLLGENARFAVEFKDCCSYHSDLQLFMNPDSNVQVLQGYFQSFRYFHPHNEDLIREQFRFLPEISIRAEQIIQEAQFEKINADVNNDGFLGVDQVQVVPEGYDDNYYYVGVHVRRGMDITWNSRNIKHGHTVATKEYFEHAMDHFRAKHKDKVVFIVCSDDLAWTMKNIPKSSAKKGEIFFSDGAFREVDLALLSQCNETIGSTGTFSWWGSYLAGGQSTYFSNWPYKGSMLDKMVDKKNYFLEEWIPME
uniref:L-Fucosyltransferase n=1 Tax=Steinernema glaseri TaxID=37863 RepID=A0A1I7ZEZ6_9BILA